MSPQAAARLPRSRAFRRQRPMGLWWLAALIALVGNLAVVVGLSQVSQLQHAEPPPPLAVRSLRQVDQAPPPPPPPPAEMPREAEPAPSEPLALALPSLDLPSAGPSSGLELPSTSHLDGTLALPVSVPAWTAIAASADGPALPGPGVAGPPTFDTPAERETAFDLDRFYPRVAKARGITGSSTVRVSIGADGRVSAVKVLSSTPAGVFDHAAERVMQIQRYRPATAGGKPVACVQDTVITWTIK
jgi:periplasmic protein TonB